MTNRTIKWGILGPGGIARKFAEDLQYADNASAVAVGSRTKDNAVRFAEQFGIARAYGSYEELVNDSEVDIIYIATPHPSHKEHIMMTLRAGKAVLCEKPFTINAAEAEEAASYARENKLFMMEAMWTRYLPAIVQVKSWLNEGKIGDVLSLQADFGFRLPWNPAHRLLDPQLGGGALLDVGIYPVSFASFVFGCQPTTIHSIGQMGETGVDERFSLLFGYEGGRTASLNGSVRLQMRNNALILGTKGSIFIPDFFMAKQATLSVYGEAEQTFTYKGPTFGYAFEANEAARCLRAGLLESDAMSVDETVGLMRTLDEIRRQWNFKYPFE